MPLILPANTLAVTGFSIDNSCRFNDGDSPNMNKTPGSSGSNSVFTFSAWLKRGDIASGAAQTFWSNGGAGISGGQGQLSFGSDNKLNLYDGASVVWTTNRLFRDPGAWFHILVSCNSGASGSAKARFWLNGTEETSFATDNRSSFSDLNGVNQSGEIMYVGSGVTTSYFDGYMAEVVLLDNTAVTGATDFGEFDSDDSPTIWKPKDVSGLTFGTHGFYLDFEASDNLGNDANGGTDLTEVNLAAVDQCTDTPTNNFCTMNPLAQVDNSGAGSNMVFSEGNCQLVQGAPQTVCGATMAPSAGKWYYEMTLSHVASKNSWFGVRSYHESWGPGNYAEPEGDGNILDGWFFKFGNDGSGGSASGSDGHVHNNKDGTYSNIDTSVTLTNDQVVGVNLDLDNGDTYLQVNGSDVYSGNTVSDLRVDQGFFYTPVFITEGGTDTTIKFNFGGCSPFTITSAVNDGNSYGKFEFEPKSGYLALCSKNLGSDGG